MRVELGPAVSFDMASAWLPACSSSHPVYARTLFFLEIARVCLRLGYLVATPHVPTDASRRQVEALASFGVPQESIAKVIEVGEKTLRKYYADVLATAEIKANGLVAQSLFNKATKGEGSASLTAAIFWLKTRARWKETLVTEHTGKDGAPVAQVHGIERMIIRSDQKGVLGLLDPVQTP